MLGIRCRIGTGNRLLRWTRLGVITGLRGCIAPRLLDGLGVVGRVDNGSRLLRWTRLRIVTGLRHCIAPRLLRRLGIVGRIGGGSGLLRWTRLRIVTGLRSRFATGLLDGRIIGWIGGRLGPLGRTRLLITAGLRRGLTLRLFRRLPSVILTTRLRFSATLLRFPLGSRPLPALHELLFLRRQRLRLGDFKRSVQVLCASRVTGKPAGHDRNQCRGQQSVFGGHCVSSCALPQTMRLMQAF